MKGGEANSLIPLLSTRLPHTRARSRLNFIQNSNRLLALYQTKEVKNERLDLNRYDAHFTIRKMLILLTDVITLNYQLLRQKN